MSIFPFAYLKSSHCPSHLRISLHFLIFPPPLPPSFLSSPLLSLQLTFSPPIFPLLSLPLTYSPFIFPFLSSPLSTSLFYLSNFNLFYHILFSFLILTYLPFFNLPSTDFAFNLTKLCLVQDKSYLRMLVIKLSPRSLQYILTSDRLSARLLALPEGLLVSHSISVLFVSQSLYLSVCLRVCICLSVCLSICLSVCLSVCLFFCISACLFMSMFVSLYVCLLIDNNY